MCVCACVCACVCVFCMDVNLLIFTIINFNLNFVNSVAQQIIQIFPLDFNVIYIGSLHKKLILNFSAERIQLLNLFSYTITKFF